MLITEKGAQKQRLDTFNMSQIPSKSILGRSGLAATQPGDTGEQCCLRSQVSFLVHGSVEGHFCPLLSGHRRSQGMLGDEDWC